MVKRCNYNSYDRPMRFPSNIHLLTRRNTINCFPNIETRYFINMQHMPCMCNNAISGKILRIWWRKIVFHTTHGTQIGCSLYFTWFKCRFRNRKISIFSGLWKHSVWKIVVGWNGADGHYLNFNCDRGRDSFFFFFIQKIIDNERYKVSRFHYDDGDDRQLYTYSTRHASVYFPTTKYYTHRCVCACVWLCPWCIPDSWNTSYPRTTNELISVLPEPI